MKLIVHLGNNSFDLLCGGNSHVWSGTWYNLNNDFSAWTDPSYNQCKQCEKVLEENRTLLELKYSTL